MDGSLFSSPPETSVLLEKGNLEPNSNNSFLPVTDDIGISNNNRELFPFVVSTLHTNCSTESAATISSAVVRNPTGFSFDVLEIFRKSDVTAILEDMSIRELQIAAFRLQAAVMKINDQAEIQIANEGKFKKGGLVNRASETDIRGFEEGKSQLRESLTASHNTPVKNSNCGNLAEISPLLFVGKKNHTTEFRATHSIHLDFIKRNFDHMTMKSSKQNCKVMAVIKADAYGHGAV